MLPPSVEDGIEDILADHTSGASQIAGMGLKTLEALVRETEGRPSPEQLREAARRIPEAQKTNAALHNVVHLFVRLVEEGQPPEEVLEHLRTELTGAREHVARTFLKLLTKRSKVVTLTFSANVLASLQAAGQADLLERVYVMESRPVNEGRFLLVALTEAGIPATLVPDALGPGLLEDADCALIGADSVLRDGAVINKIGSYGLGLAAKDHGKPLYVATESLKFDARFDSSAWAGSPSMPAKEIWDRPPREIDVMNRYFEVVPARLVTMIATERGAYAPETIRTMLAQARAQK